MLTVFRFAHRTRRTALFASAAAAAAALALWASGGFQSAAAQTAGASFSARLVITGGAQPVSFPLENYGFATIAPSGASTRPGFVFRFQKQTSTQSRDLWLGLMEGNHFETATLNVLKSGTLYLRVVMEDVLVKRLVTVGAGAEQPQDALVVLTAAKVRARYPSSTETTQSEVGREYDQPDWDIGKATTK